MTTASTRPLAVVTGASSGIGYELARQFVQNGFDIIIAAENDEINEAAISLSMPGVLVKPVKVDLAEREGVEELYRVIQSDGRSLDSIAINAGVGTCGDFASETELEDELNLIALNITSSVHLAKLVLKNMVANGHGRVLITASIAALMPGSYSAVYNASKAFLLLFSEGIREELKDTGVTVTALMPGATDTDFFRRADMEDTKVAAGKKDSPADVAQDGFEAMMAGKDKVIAHSFKAKMQAVLSDVLPDPVAAKMHAQESKPGTASH